MATLIGLAGDSGTGKTTLARLIARPLRATIISLDDYHRYGREERRRMGVSPLNPDVSDFEWVRRNLLDLKRGREIEKPVYDHRTGTAMARTELIRPARHIIVEGLLPYYTRKLARLYDFRIFVQPEMELQVEWKLKRDEKVRNYSEQFDLVERKGDFRKYVLPQKKLADAVISQFRSQVRKGSVGCRLTLGRAPEFSLPFRRGNYSVSVRRGKGLELSLDGNLSPLFGATRPVEVAALLIVKLLEGKRW